MTLLNHLRNISFFDSLTDDQLNELANAGTARSCPANESVLCEGDSADSLYVVLSGRVRVTRLGPAGTTIELSQLGPGAFFGELALFDGGARSATVTTIEPAEFFVLARKPFIAQLAGTPKLLTDVLAGLSSKIRASNEKLFREWQERQTLESEMVLQRHRSIAEMTAGVAHEINTPLGIVNNAASFIAESLAATEPGSGGDRTDIVEACRLIESNIARANRLIQSFKSLSVSQITESRESVNLPQLVGEVVDLFHINAKRARLDIKLTNRIPIEHASWDGYPGYLTQVLLNLLSNVERYAYPDGGGRVEIDLSLSSAAAASPFTISVRDFGRGIARENLDRIFEAFFTTGRSIGGSGLGLAITHNLVTSALKGTIQVESREGQGARFQVTLPQTLP